MSTVHLARGYFVDSVDILLQNNLAVRNPSRDSSTIYPYGEPEYYAFILGSNQERILRYAHQKAAPFSKWAEDRVPVIIHMCVTENTFENLRGKITLTNYEETTRKRMFELRRDIVWEYRFEPPVDNFDQLLRYGDCQIEVGLRLSQITAEQNRALNTRIGLYDGNKFLFRPLNDLIAEQAIRREGLLNRL